MTDPDVLAEQLAEARTQVAMLTEQLAMAERVHAALRSRIASLELELEHANSRSPGGVAAAGAPTPGLSAESAADLEAAAAFLVRHDDVPRPRPSSPADYGFGEHEDDLLPTLDDDDKGRSGR